MFRTEVNPQISTRKISLETPILTMGSCFSDHIGGQLAQNKFDVLCNPFGVIFNPVSINKLLHIAIKNSTIDTKNWVQSQGINLHYDVHSQLGSINQEEANVNIDQAISTAHQHLQKANWLIITWGTALVYKRKDTDEIVANCHKVPADQFTKKMLTSDEIVADFETMLSELPTNINVLLTVSPVRHWKETLELNSVSKSILRVACHELSSKYDRVHYFPAYELVLDDLRDYRFYKPDMLHPSDEAIKYVWDKFIQAYFDESTVSFVEQWKKILTAINHQPFNPQSTAHQNFLKATIKMMTEMNSLVDITKEINQLELQLTK